jgi:hypothetical protein
MVELIAEEKDASLRLGGGSDLETLSRRAFWPMPRM